MQIKDIELNNNGLNITLNTKEKDFQLQEIEVFQITKK